MSSRLVNRNVLTVERRTSMRLEPEFWHALQEICAREALSLSALVQRLETGRDQAGRTSTVRVHVLNYFRAAATASGHAEAGHGEMTSSG